MAIERRRAREPSYRGVRRRPMLFAAGRHRARRSGPRTHRPTRRMIIAAVLAGVVVPLSYAAFAGTTGNAGNVFAAAATFPTYPDAVGADGPLFQHRGEEAQSAAATSAAADSSGNNRPGVYQGRTDGPATWWRFDENAGSTVADASGAVNPGTLTGANAGWAAGPAGSALSVTTGTGYVLGSAPVRTDDSFSVAAWVNLAATGADRTAVSQRGAQTSAFALRYHSSGRWEFAAARTDVSSPTVDQVTSTVAANPATWVHLVGVYDDPADQIRLYVDGARQGAGTAKTAEWHAGTNLLAGRAWLAGALAEQWLGQLDDVRVYRRALDDAEVAAVYHAPVTAWEFEENAGAAVADSAHRNNPGTFTGTNYWSASGYSGNAGNFSGDDHVAGVAAGVRTDESFTVAAWVYLTDDAAARAAVSLPGATSSGFVLKHQSNKWEFRLPRSDVAAPTSDTAVSTSAAATHSWVHLAGVYDDRADEVRLYVNGVLEGTATHTAEWAAGGVLTAGRSWWAGAAAEPWVGRLDRIRLYDHALGTADVSSLYLDPTLHWGLNEAGGTATADGTGRGNTGTLSGATWATGPDDSPALSFDGNATVSGTGPAVDTTQSFTVAAWVRLTDKLDHYAIVTQNGTTSHSWSLRYDGVNDRFSFYILRSEAQATPTVFSLGGSSPVAGTWYHLVGVFDDAIDNTRLYVNGAASGPNGTQTYSDADEWSATGPVQLGHRVLSGASGRRLKGQIDEVRTYQRALSQTDAQRLYAQAAPSPYLRWQFSEGAGSSVADSSGNGLTGTQDDTSAWTSAGYIGSAYHNSSGTSGRTASAAVVTPADNSYTAAGWVYLTDTSATRTAFSTDGQNVSAYAVQYYQPTGRWAVHMRGSDANAAATSRAESTSSAQANTWVHLTVVYDDPADQLRLYVNGALAGTPATVTTDWTNGWNFFVVGRAKDNGAGVQYWRGSVDDVRAFRSALSGDAVRTLMGAVPPLPVVAVSAPLAARQTGALQGAQQGLQATAAVAFNGNGAAHNPIQYANPSTFTVSGWFRAAGTAGGSIIGFSSSPTAMSGDSTDRVVYLDSGGRLTFAVSPGGVQSVRSTAAYNDGAWHHVAVSLGAAGMRLYVDGALVASNASVTSAQNGSGYWRWGGTRLSGLPNAPASNYFIGSLDEIAVFGGQLTDRQLAVHYHANH